MAPVEFDAARAALAQALADAHDARLGLPPEVEHLVRAYARMHREAGSDISAVLVELKALVRDHSGGDAFIFIPKIVGWTVAGFFAGTSAHPR